VTFRGDLFFPRLAAWNALLQHLDYVQLSSGADEFPWNLHANGAFSIDSLYKENFQSDIPIDNNDACGTVNVNHRPVGNPKRKV
jgi:hypothetical protein